MSEKSTYEELEQRVQELEQAESERKIQEENSKNALELLYFFIKHSPIYAFLKKVSHEDSTVLYASDNYIDMIGVPASQMAGKTMYELFPKDFAEKITRDDIAVINKGNSLILDEEFNGRTYVTYKFPLRQGEDTYLAGYSVDITDLKRKEEELRKNEERLQFVLQGSQLGYWDWNIKTGEVVRNEEWAKMLGYTLEEIDFSVRQWTDLHHPDDRNAVWQSIQDHLEGRTSEHKIEYRMRTKRGQYKWILDQAKIVNRDSAGKPLRMSGTHTDITERKNAEQESLILKTAIDQAPVGIALADENINIYYCNPEGLGMRGGAPEDLVQIPKDIFTNWQVLRLNGKPYEVENLPLVRAITKGKTIREDFIVRHCDGSDHICDASAYPIYENGTIIGGMVIFLDVSERKQAEDALRASHERFLTVLNSIDATIFVADMETHEILFMNKCMVNSFGRDMTGEICWDAFRGEAGPCSFCTNDKLINESGRPTDVCVWHDRNPITGRWNVNYDRAIEWIDGRIVRIQIATDITELKKMESQLRQAQKMESIGKLAGGIAHDFNNILSSILGFSELALDEVEKGSTMEDNLQEIYAGGLRAKEIVTQILTFARQSDKDKKPTRVDSIIIEALKLIRPSTPTTIEIRKELESSSLVMGNATQIHQIIMNLCANAAQAMQDDGGIMEVTLKDVLVAGDTRIPAALEKGKYIKLTISDTGCGIEPEHIDSIFDPYFTTKDTGEGTGMGLAMVRGIVDSYGGSITVESAPSRKTVFTVYLPIAGNQENEIIYETGPLPKGSEHILFVDDEPQIARMGSRILENLGYQVTTRTSSIEALEVFKAKPGEFQLVITDMTMPHMTGDKFAIELKKIRANIPIILCTGYSNKINAEIAHEIGINAFTYKPFSKAELAATVKEVLDKA
jgi:PAS domain S-box-containing protein